MGVYSSPKSLSFPSSKSENPYLSPIVISFQLHLKSLSFPSSGQCFSKILIFPHQWTVFFSKKLIFPQQWTAFHSKSLYFPTSGQYFQKKAYLSPLVDSGFYQSHYTSLFILPKILIFPHENLIFPHLPPPRIREDYTPMMQRVLYYTLWFNVIFSQVQVTIPGM